MNLKSVWDPAGVIRLWGIVHVPGVHLCCAHLTPLHSVKQIAILCTAFWVRKLRRVGGVLNTSENFDLR